MAQSSSSQRRTFWTVILGGGAVLLACLAAYLAGQVGDPGWWRREATAYNLRHAVPDEGNAALYYTNALGFSGIDTKVHKGIIQVDWKSPLATSELALLEGLDPALDALEGATRLPHCVYRLDPEIRPFEYGLPYLSRFKPAVQLLALRARARAAEGRSVEAGEDLLAALRMGAHQDRGFLIHQLVGVACKGYAYPGLERLAMDAPPAPEVLERMAAEMGRLEASRPSAAERWEAEHLMGRGNLECLYRPGQAMNLIASSGPGGLRGTWAWLGLAFTKPLHRCRQDHEALSALQAKEKPTPADLARMDVLATSNPLLFSGARPRESFRKGLAMERGTRILLQLRAKRLREGSYPETLAGLDAPEDPFSGRPFVYRRLDPDAFLLYSLGPNGVDDGGTLDFRDPKGFNGPSDMIFGRPPTP